MRFSYKRQGALFSCRHHPTVPERLLYLTADVWHSLFLCWHTVLNLFWRCPKLPRTTEDSRTGEATDVEDLGQLLLSVTPTVQLLIGIDRVCRSYKALRSSDKSFGYLKISSSSPFGNTLKEASLLDYIYCHARCRR